MAHVWLITGSARGRGRAIAEGVLAAGDKLIAAVERAQAHFGGIDVLVNNAGIDFLGAVEEQREEDYRAQFEVNFFGAVAMLRSLLGTLYSSRQMGRSSGHPRPAWLRLSDRRRVRCRPRRVSRRRWPSAVS
jgi:NAD(P)-dependent dehydrogenase (short-subunit alcohol dehydrogenase family)